MNRLSTRVRDTDLAKGAYLVALLLGFLTFGSFGAVRDARAAELTPQQKQEMKILYEKATRAYDVGKYAEAIEEYQKAYEIGGDPPMLYNIAQAFRLNDQPGEALRFYRRYLQRAPNARNREDVERKMADLERSVEEKRKAQAASAPPPVAAPPLTPAKAPPVLGPPAPAAPAPATPAVSATGTPDLTQPAPPPEEGSSTQRIVGWSVIGVGVAAGVGSVIAGLMAKSKADEVTAASMKTPPQEFNPDPELSGKNLDKWAIGLGIGAGAAVITGAILVLTGGSSAEAPAEAPATTASVVPWVTGNIVGAGADFRF